MWLCLMMICLVSICRAQSVDVSQFGAKGDGVSDDSVALAAAIAGGSTINLSTGHTYRVSGVVLRAFQTISGNGARLIPSSGGTVLTIAGGPQLQSNGKTKIMDLEVDGGGVRDAIGLVVGNTAQLILDGVNIHDCAVGLVFNSTQFADLYSLRLYHNRIGMKVYSDPDAGGGNSLNFFGGQVVGNVVGIIFASPRYPQGANYFFNTSFLANSVAVAAFGTSDEVVTFYGGAPEANAPPNAPLSIVVDGHKIQRAAFFANHATFVFDNTAVADAQANPWAILANHSKARAHNLSGYGQPNGVLFEADDTSEVLFSGINSVIGTSQNVGEWPHLQLGSSWTGYGAPVAMPSGVPNLFAGNSASPGIQARAPATGGTIVDPQFGRLNTAQFAPSVGTTESNRVVLAGLAAPVSVPTDLVVSVLVKSDQDCMIRFGNYPDQTVGATAHLIGGNWTRLVFAVPSLGAGQNLAPMFYAQDAKGCAIAFAQMHIGGGPSGTNGTRQTIRQVIQ